MEATDQRATGLTPHQEGLLAAGRVLRVLDTNMMMASLEERRVVLERLVEEAGSWRESLEEMAEDDETGDLELVGRLVMPRHCLLPAEDRCALGAAFLEGAWAEGAGLRDSSGDPDGSMMRSAWLQGYWLSRAMRGLRGLREGEELDDLEVVPTRPRPEVSHVG